MDKFPCDSGSDSQQQARRQRTSQQAITYRVLAFRAAVCRIKATHTRKSRPAVPRCYINLRLRSTPFLC
ncbi:hypothetical protein E2C01_067051 [Portunus trituberculatus]|uniref:Uncharacterized protein n=1 Tax=Portunus trituberculatus TaxID=210409 RepID=A0A5B7HSJ7_PORTR|nr:hypothetical protein [Portunus trituberculatus]